MTGALAFQQAAVSGQINQDQRQEFLSLYPNRIQGILRPPGCQSWTTVSKHWPIEDKTIYGAIADKETNLWGLRWAEQTRFAVLDIDKNSKYHNIQELEQLQKVLVEIRLAATLYQSSESTGWHLYIPFVDWMNSKDVEKTLKDWLKTKGYDIRCGQLEVFPSGQALRLPLQTGFAWLDDQGAIKLRREEISTEQALELFLNDLRKNARDWLTSKRLIDTELEMISVSAGGVAQAQQERLNISGLEGLFAGGKIQENWERGRELWQHGLLAKGQRHDAVMFVGHYLWYGDPDQGVTAIPGTFNDEYRARLIEEWLEKKHNGYCRHINQNKWEIIREQIKRAVLWRGDLQEQEYEPYRLTGRLLKRFLAIYRKTGRIFTVEEFQKANERSRETARNKIQQAVSDCVTEGRQISRSTLEKLTGCSPNTLKKHGDLWRLLAIGSGEYNSGGRGALVLLPGSSEAKRENFSSVNLGDSGDLEKSEEQERLELAPIVLTPPFLLPGDEPTSELPVSISVRSLNGDPPSCAKPPLGPPHLPLTPIDTGSLVRWYLGRTANAAGGLELSCIRQGYFEIMPGRRGYSSTIFPRQLSDGQIGLLGCGIISSLMGLISETGVDLPVNLLPGAVGVKGLLASNSKNSIVCFSSNLQVDSRHRRWVNKHFGISCKKGARAPPFVHGL